MKGRGTFGVIASIAVLSLLFGLWAFGPHDVADDRHHADDGCELGDHQRADQEDRDGLAEVIAKCKQRRLTGEDRQAAHGHDHDVGEQRCENERPRQRHAVACPGGRHRGDAAGTDHVADHENAGRDRGGEANKFCQP